jgi:hypothetical protein
LFCSLPPIFFANYRIWLSNIFVKVLQIFPHRHHKLVSVGAIDDAVIVTNGKPDDVPHGN